MTERKTGASANRAPRNTTVVETHDGVRAGTVLATAAAVVFAGAALFEGGVLYSNSQKPSTLNDGQNSGQSFDNGAARASSIASAAGTDNGNGIGAATAAPVAPETAQVPQGCNVDMQTLLSNTDNMLKSTVNDAPMDTFFHPIANPGQFQKDGSGQWSWGISLLKSSLSEHVNFYDMGSAGEFVARPDLNGTPKVTFCILVDQKFLSQYNWGQRKDGSYGPLTGVQTAFNINSTPGATVTIENMETGNIVVQPPLSSGGDGMWDLGGANGIYKFTITRIEAKKDTTGRIGPDDRPTAPLYRQPMP